MGRKKRGVIMAYEQKKEKSKFQKITMAVVIIMLILTVIGVIIGAVAALL